MEFADDETIFLIPKSYRPTRTRTRNVRRFCKKNLTMCLILVSLACERSAFFIVDYHLDQTLQSNNTLNWNDDNSSTVYHIFEGCHVIAMFVFAFLSDIKLGRMKTLLLGYPLLLFGFIMMTLIAKNNSPVCRYDRNTLDFILNNTEMSISNDYCISLVIPIVIIISIGSAAIRSSLVLFGADQIQQSKIISPYFDLCIIAYEIGAIVEISLADLIMPGPDQFYHMFLIGSCLLFTSFLLLLLGCRSYIYVDVYDSVLYYCIPVIKNAYETRRRYKKKKYRLIIETSFSTISQTNIEQEIEEFMRMNRQTPNFLDMARISNRGKYRDAIVDDVKSFRTAIILFILIFPYRLIYNQLFSVLDDQNDKMARSKDLLYLNTLAENTEPITIIIGILIANIFFYKYFHGLNRLFTTTRKFIASMFFAILAMCLAFAIEIIRQTKCPSSPESNISDLPISAHIPMDITIGIGQMFNLMASFEFAYFVAPRSAQSIFMTFHTCSVIAASNVGYGFNNLLSSYNYTFDFSCSSVRDYGWIYPSYFLAFAFAQYIFILLFLACDRKLRLTRFNPQQTAMNQLD